MMPVMDGFEATQVISELYRDECIDQNECQIVGLSAMTAAEDKAKGL